MNEVKTLEIIGKIIEFLAEMGLSTSQIAAIGATTNLYIAAAHGMPPEEFSQMLDGFKKQYPEFLEKYRHQ